MSEEEIIEIIEELQCEYKEQQNDKKYNDYTVHKAKRYSYGLQGLLDLYNKETEYAMGLYYDNQGLQQDLDNSISKDKIEEVMKDCVSSYDCLKEKIYILLYGDE